jgi:peptidoglycan hydrolase-like protein with peptidoglycan-binding domain
MLARIAEFRAQMSRKSIILAPPSPLPAGPTTSKPEHVAGPVALVSTEDVQAALNRLGCGPVTVDGSYGPRTQEGVKAFQGRRGCTVDGWVGEETREAMIETLGSASAASDAATA